MKSPKRSTPKRSTPKRSAPKLTKSTLSDVVRYAGLSVCTYGVLLGSIFILVTGLGQNSGAAYAASYTLAYVLSYLALSRYVFVTKPSSQNVMKFVAQTFVFFILNNVGFFLLVKVAKVHYFLAAVALIGLLFPLRFASAKWLVFAQ